MRILLLASVCAVSLVWGRPAEQYTDKFDSIDLKEALTNPRLLAAYVKCLLDEGKCTAEGKELKIHVREALENDCAKCTPTQRGGTRTVIAHLINKEPAYWKQLTAKYDSAGKYVRKYEKELRTVKA